jgi:hypothetical protein
MVPHTCQCWVLLSVFWSLANVGYSGILSFNLKFPNSTWCWTYFICLFAICIPLVKYLLKSSAHVFSEVIFLLLRCKNSLYIFCSSSFSNKSFANIFS